MTVTINSLTIGNLQALPVAYDEVNVRQGIAVRAWDFDGILKSADAAAVSNAFETWQSVRNSEPDSLGSNSVGTTVAFTGYDGTRTWSAVACWFDSAPKIQRLGFRWRISFRLIDAAASLAASLAQKRISRQQDEGWSPDFGTLALGGVLLYLQSEKESRGQGPTVSTAATGTDLIEGPLRPVRIRDIKGFGSNSGRTDFDSLLSWYDSIVATRPAAGTWFPVSPPTAEPSVIVDGTGKAVRYMISMQLRYIE